MTKLDILRALGRIEPHGYGDCIGLNGANGVLAEFWRLVIREVKAGRKVVVPSVGVFYPKRHRQKRVVAPDGGEHVMPPSVRLGFRASKHTRWVTR